MIEKQFGTEYGPALLGSNPRSLGQLPDTRRSRGSTTSVYAVVSEASG
jgi:hypothetical protein